MDDVIDGVERGGRYKPPALPPTRGDPAIQGPRRDDDKGAGRREGRRAGRKERGETSASAF